MVTIRETRADIYARTFRTLQEVSKTDRWPSSPVATFSTRHPAIAHLHVFMVGKFWLVFHGPADGPCPSPEMDEFIVFTSPSAAMLYAETVAKALQHDATSWDAASCG